MAHGDSALGGILYGYAATAINYALALLTRYKTTDAYAAYNVAAEDWITVDEVADLVIEAMGLTNVKKTYKPVLHGVGWPGDVKKIALKTAKS